ncbi:DUF4340 domain-containing protein [Archangium lipolyticum]|uniref:DUF4340 domain-containing protein n=1 Tax=Archangium lipolyticum TaxID=2970465 RepID=UPI0021499FAD|nr:DUF4340 domain-containing protein [Archangium lipolyticum]
MNARQKNLVSVLAATLAACGLGLYTYFGVMKPEEQEAQRKEVEDKLFVTHDPGERGQDGGAPPAPVFTHLSVEMTGSKTEMQLVEGQWRVTAPVSALANKTEVDALTQELASAKFLSVLDKNPTDADLERYGLKPPVVTVTARAYVPDAKGGGAEEPSRQRTLTFHTGVENRFDGSVYVRREGDPAVYSSQGSLRFAVQKRTHDWRDHEAFPVNEPSLLRIEVKTRKNAFTLERASTDKPWQLTKPVALRADGERVASMVSTFKGYRALTFPERDWEAKARAALEKPVVEALFVPHLGDPLRVRLAEADLNGMKQIVSLSEWGRDSVLALVDSNTVNVLDLAVSEFKDKKALAFTADDVHHIVIHPAAGGELVKLAKTLDTKTWEVVAPMPGKAREFKVASLLGSLEKLKAAALGEARPKSWSRYGISDSSRGVALLDAQGKELVRLSVGNEVKGNPKRLWARGSGEEVLELEKSVLDALPLKLEDLMQGVPAANGSP